MRWASNSTRRPRRHRVRFIPARAGNTKCLHSGSVRSAVHPRACGEHMVGAHVARWSSGSSPRVRGTHLLGRHARHLLRFIPARAGNTRPGAASAHQEPVHPRACGEHLCEPFNVFLADGSSPRVRGTLIIKERIYEDPRFIPARAGNTLHALENSAFQTVHPRACGEHIAPMANILIASGSSPRVRGTLLLRCCPGP